jgi:hypothetical protein
MEKVRIPCGDVLRRDMSWGRMSLKGIMMCPWSGEREGLEKGTYFEILDSSM